jgi:hypothetical protein
MKIYRSEQWMQADASIHIFSSECEGQEMPTHEHDFIEIVSAFHKNGVTIEYQDGDGNTRNLLEVLEQLRTANLNLAEPECGEDEEPDESPRIQM